MAVATGTSRPSRGSPEEQAVELGDADELVLGQVLQRDRPRVGCVDGPAHPGHDHALADDDVGVRPAVGRVGVHRALAGGLRWRPEPHDAEPGHGRQLLVAQQLDERLRGPVPLGGLHPLLGRDAAAGTALGRAQPAVAVRPDGDGGLDAQPVAVHDDELIVGHIAVQPVLCAPWGGTPLPVTPCTGIPLPDTASSDRAGPCHSGRPRGSSIQAALSSTERYLVGLCPADHHEQRGASRRAVDHGSASVSRAASTSSARVAGLTKASRSTHSPCHRVGTQRKSPASACFFDQVE